MPVLSWSPRARRALNAALAALSTEDAGQAAALYARIDEVAPRLLADPAMGRAGRIAGTRELAIARTPITLVYSVERSEVRIIALHQSGYPE